MRMKIVRGSLARLVIVNASFTGKPPIGFVSGATSNETPSSGGNGSGSVAAQRSPIIAARMSTRRPEQTVSFTSGGCAGADGSLSSDAAPLTRAGTGLAAAGALDTSAGCEPPQPNATSVTAAAMVFS